MGISSCVWQENALVAEVAKAVGVVSSGLNTIGNAPVYTVLLTAAAKGAMRASTCRSMYDLGIAPRCHGRSGSLSDHAPLFGASAELHQSLNVVWRVAPRELPAIWFEALW